MIATIQPIERYLQYDKVAFYTLHMGPREWDEFNDFNLRMKAKLKNPEELQVMLRLIENLGTKWGAKRKYFKDESGAERFLLPLEVHTTENSEFGLRLYCLLLRPEIVIILNGDIKTTQLPQDCPNCKPHFELARKVGRLIDKHINAKEIILDGFDIIVDDDFELNL